MIVPYSAILKKVKIGEWAIPTFNTFGIAMTRAILDAAVSERAPVVIEISKSSLEHGGGQILVDSVKSMASQVKNPVALHYDHGKKTKEIKAALKMSFSSVMAAYDIKKSLSNNMTTAKNIASIAHKSGKMVQGEVGHVTGPKDHWKMPIKWLTSPDQAHEYVEYTKVDALSVSVGNRHGIASGSVQIDIDRLKAIRKQVEIPLVLHGGSGLWRTNYLKAIKAGVAIINFDTDLRYAYGKALRKHLGTQLEVMDPRGATAWAIKSATIVAQNKIKACRASGRA